MNLYHSIALNHSVLRKTGLFYSTRMLVLQLLLIGCLGTAFTGLPANAQVVQEMPASSVNINTADAQTLASGLNGVGLSRAEDIIRYREAYGPFATVEELTSVKGIGKSTLEKNRQVITLE
ncbi:MAG: helix-hairpin-helix domain-containing protein [Halioglobus sp.]